MSTFGATSWDTEPSNGGQNRKGSDTFLKLESGDNVMRIVTKPHEYLVHDFKPIKDAPGYGTKLKSSMYHGADPLCEAPWNLKPKQRWYLGVIDRKTQSYKILDISSSVFKGIQVLVRDEDWGDPSQYDVNVKVNKQGGAAGYYMVTPKSKKPLSASDLDIRNNINPEDLKRRCTPPTYEDVKKRMDEVITKANISGDNVTASVPVVKSDVVAKVETVETPQTVETDTNVDDFDFPAADE